MKIKFKKLSETAVAPIHGSEFAAGFDLTVDTCEICGANSYFTYNSNIAVEIPEGHVGLLFPRSSIYRCDLSLTNSVGVIDSDYRGPIKAVFKGSHPYYKVGERFAQLVIVPNPKVEYAEAEELSETTRGTGGYGSTGK